MSVYSSTNTLISIAATLPLVVCIRDSLYSLCKVKGSSMEPNVKHGDILLVRKADFPKFRWNNKPDEAGDDDDDDGIDFNNRRDNHNENNSHENVSGPLMRNRRLREYEYQYHLAQHDATVWFRCPPWPLRGQVVTYKSPYKFPSELCVKRVVGVAGQVVETTEGMTDVDINSIWVEGDNHDNSSDSRDHGAVNQKLVVGVAEYIIWPPTRFCKIPKIIDDRRSYWP